jgi:hypothetical protein
MADNEGFLDRAVRVIVGLALLAFPLGVFGIENAHAWGWIGVVPLMTGLVGICPLYSLLGIRTCRPAA